jgi:starch-binding outer membrane protein, SusD/RagB family
MKIKAKLILIILALSVQFSCNDWMALTPPEGLIREEFWKTKEDVQAVLMGAYASFAQMDNLFFLYGEIRGDLVTADFNVGNDEKKVMESNIYPDNYLCDWSSFYKVINYCNEVISFAPQVKERDNTFSDYQLKGFLSEAYFMRSLAYFYLVRVFKDVPLVVEPTTSDDAKLYIPKTDGDEILTLMLSELKEASAWATIDGYQTLQEVKSRATKAAIYALIADIALWQFDYQTSIEYVDKITALNKYQLNPSNEWFENFYPYTEPVSLENIFEFFYDDAANQRNHTYGMTQRYSYSYDPSEKALQMFGKKFVRELYRGEDASIKKYSESEYIIWKYVGKFPDGETFRSGIEQNSCHWIVYRYADVLLMKAEALSQTGKYIEALDIINKIRDRADVPLISLANSAIAFEDAILEERALELAFEGKRWFDLMRMGRRNNYARKSKLIEVIVANVPSTQKRVLATKLSNPLGWYLPIYASEIERNKALIQNPYYNF